jgi:hypothetical protein
VRAEVVREAERRKRRSVAAGVAEGRRGRQRAAGAATSAARNVRRDGMPTASHVIALPARLPRRRHRATPLEGSRRFN